MSSKKKSGKADKKNNKKFGKGQELEDKLQQTTVEMRAMEDYVAQRKYLLMRSKADEEEWQKQVNLLKVDMETQTGDYKAISADMTRQYKTLEAEMTVRIHLLETEMAHYKQKLSETEAEVEAAKKERKILFMQKQDEIVLLKQKKKAMENSFEKVLHEALDNLVLKVNRANKEWEKRSRMIRHSNKKNLQDINPLTNI